MPKKHHFASAELRALDQRVRELEEAVFAPTLNGLPENIEVRSETVGDVTKITLCHRDEPALEATQEVADALQPDRYFIRAEGYGWYTVRSGATGEPMHEGKLRKTDAETLLAEVMNA